MLCSVIVEPFHPSCVQCDMRAAEGEVQPDRRDDDTPAASLLLARIAELARRTTPAPIPPRAPRLEPPSAPSASGTARTSPPAASGTPASDPDFITPRSPRPRVREPSRVGHAQRPLWCFLEGARVGGNKLTHAVELLAFTVVWRPGMQISPAQSPCSLLRGLDQHCYREVKGSRGSTSRDQQFLEW